MMGRLAGLLVAAVLACCLAGPASADGSQRPPEPLKVLAMLRLPAPHARPGGDDGGAYGDLAGRSALRRIAERLARDNGLAFAEDWPMPLLGVDCVVLVAPDGRSAEEVARRLAADPDVVWSQPMNLYRAEAAPPPTARLYLAEPAATEWRLTALHRVATGRNVRVALIDSMVDAHHPDLLGQVLDERNFVDGRASAPEAHGTAVAGVIAAKGVGVTGVAPGARLMALRACWQQATPAASGATYCDSLSLAKALSFAVERGSEVINLSLAGPVDPLLAKLLDVALAKRIVVVAAVDPSLPGGGFPASHPGVVAVADETLGPEPAGVYGAPGREIPTTTLGGGWGLVNGSSFAAAHVSGLFALLRQRGEGARPVRLAVRRGGAIDACATLLGRSPDCAPVPMRQAAIARRQP